MRPTAFLKTGMMALCLGLLCGSCVVHRDRPPHHKKHKPHKKPKPPKHPHHRHHGCVDFDKACRMLPHVT